MVKLVWFSEIQWDYLVTRKQQVLKRFPADWDILFVEPFVVGKQQHWRPCRRGNITVLTIPFLKTIPQPALAAIQDVRIMRWLAGGFGWLYFTLFSLLLGFASRQRLIGLSSAYWGRIAARLPAARHCYDANDAHLDFPSTPVWLRGYLEAYLRVADIVFAVSPEIRESVQQLGGHHVHLLGNGVDYEHFSHQQERPVELDTINTQILGYAGAMDWLDPELIRRVCLAYPEYTVILIGPEIRPGWFSSQSEFKGLANLRYLGRVKYRVLPAYIQAFSVALIPFVVNDLTRPLNPNKLYEYCAAGKPVVSMNYSSTIRGLRKVIYVADTREAFVEQISEALQVPQDSRRQELARGNSWDHVAKQMKQAFLSTQGADA